MTTKRKLLTVTVNVPDWLHGDSGNSMLLDHEDNMCCLGFVGRKLGFSDGEMLNQASPRLLSFGKGARKWKSVGLLDEQNSNHDSDLCTDLMSINDAEYDVEMNYRSRPGTFELRSEEDRKRLLRELGKEAGIGFRFVEREKVSR